MGELPTDLSAMLEAVEKYMGEQFTQLLDHAIHMDSLAAARVAREDERFISSGKR